MLFVTIRISACGPMKPAHGTAVDGSDACGSFKNAFYIMNIKEKKRLFRQKVVPLQVEINSDNIFKVTI